MYMNADPRGEGTALRITECLQGSQSQSRSCSPVAAVHSFAGGSAPGIAMPASGSSQGPGKAAASPKRTCYACGPTFLKSRYRCGSRAMVLGQGQRVVLDWTGLSITLS